jgi:hypothetical protein
MKLAHPGVYLSVADILEEKFREWTQGKNAVEARVSIYQRVRDIPYAIIPRLNHSERYVEILKLGRGSCTPKHFLLGNMFHRLGIPVLYVVYPFRWGDWDPAGMEFSYRLWKLSQEQPLSYHLACKVEMEGRLVLVDATLDSGLRKAGLPVNSEWDGFSDTQLPVNPCGQEQIYHPSELHLMQARNDEKSLIFYDELNRCFEAVRRF